MGMVKWYSPSVMSGAPQLTSTPGSLLEVLDACLVNGFGSKPVTNLVINNGVATATVAGGHTFVPDCVARIVGGVSTGGQINGEARVSAIGLNTISWPTTLPNQTVTGSPVIDMAPAGWEKMRTGNVGAYRATSPLATKFWLQVKNDYTSESPGANNWIGATVLGFETMGDALAGTAQFPAAVDKPTGLLWGLGNTSSPGDARHWSLYADDQAFYICLAAHRGANYQAVCGFGDILPANPADVYACAVIGSGFTFGNDVNHTYSGNLAYPSTFSAGPPGVGAFLARSFSGLEGGVGAYTNSAAKLQLDVANAANMSGGTGHLAPYPNPADNGLILAPAFYYEISAPALRGFTPGFLFATQRVGAAIPDGTVLAGSGALATRKIRAVGIGNSGDQARGVAFFDITGPWR